ncbi:hypothetical protein V8E36_006032 [Tilletia maclaganii]
MPNWQDPIEIKKDIAVNEILIWISLGFAVREQMSTSAFDWTIMSGRRPRRWPQLVYFLVKLSYWSCLCCVLLYQFSGRELDCATLFTAMEALSGLVTIFASSLLALRTICVIQDHNARKVVALSLILFEAGLCAAWFFCAGRTKSVWLPTAESWARPWAPGICYAESLHAPTTIRFIVTFFFDFYIFALTTYGLAKMNATGTRVGEMLFHQGMIYFVVTAASNLLAASIAFAQLNSAMSLMFIVPVMTVSAIASTRLYVQLAEGTSRGAVVQSARGDALVGQDVGVDSSGRKPVSVFGIKVPGMGALEKDRQARAGPRSPMSPISLQTPNPSRVRSLPPILIGKDAAWRDESPAMDLAHQQSTSCAGSTSIDTIRTVRATSSHVIIFKE